MKFHANEFGNLGQRYLESKEEIFFDIIASLSFILLVHKYPEISFFKFESHLVAKMFAHQLLAAAEMAWM